MCNAIAEGGRRCAVHRHDSLAAVNLSVAESGLTEKQVSDVFTELRREGRGEGRGSADIREWTTYLRELKTANEAADTRPENAVNIQKAFDGEINAPDKATFYALKNLKARVAQRRLAEKAAIDEVAKKTRQDPAKIEEKYRAEIKKVDVSRKAEVPTEYTESAVKSAQSKNLPSDRASVVAMAKVAEVEREETPVVTREELTEEQSPTFSSAGYDHRSRRMEVAFRHDGMAYSYTPTYSYRNVPPVVWNSFTENYNPSALREVIGNEEHQYESAAADAAAAHAVKCPECGQFTAESHTCPTVIAKTEKPKKARAARKSSVAKKVEEKPAPETPAVIDPLDHPDQIIDGVRHLQVDSPDLPEYKDNESNQSLPKTVVTAEEHPLMDITVNDLVEGEVENFHVVSKRQLLDTLVNNERLDPELRARIEAAPDSARFGVNKAPWIERYNSQMFSVINPISSIWNDPTSASEVETVDIAFSYDSDKMHLVRINNVDGGTIRLRNRPKRRKIEEKVYTEAEAHQARLATLDRISEAVDSGDAVVVGANSTFTRRFIVDGSLREQPKVRFGRTNDVKSGLKAGKLVVSEMEMEIPSSDSWKGQDGVDDQGYQAPTGFYSPTISGRVGMRYNESTKTVEISDDHTQLKCDCYDYRRKYYCQHVNYARRHVANIGRQNLPVASRHNILTTGLSRRPNVRVVEREGGDPYISVVHPDTDTNMHYGDYTLQSTTPVSLPEGMYRNDVTREQLRESMSEGRAVLAMSYVQRVRPKGMLKDALKRADTQIPLTIAYKTERNADGAYSPTVTGTAILKKTTDMSDISVVSHDLKCTCPEYQENYDCKHVRGAAKHAHLAVSDPEEGTPTLIDLHVTSNSSARQTEMEVQNAIFLNPDRDEQEIRAEVEERRAAIERAEQERAERQRQEREEWQRRHREREERLLEERRQERERVAEASRLAEASYNSYRDRLMDRYSSVEPGYTNNPEKFHADVERLAANKEFDYAYENVLGGAGDGEGARKFGVELEFVMDPNMTYTERRNKLQAIAAELHEEDLTDSPRQAGYHSGARSGWAKWTFESDCTVDGEIVSPLLGDDRESWEQLEKVCKIVKKHGGTVNHRVGSHVHVSTGSYGFSTAKHGELNRTVTQNEDLMYRLAANPAKKVHRGTQWCSPNVVDSEDDIPEDVRRGTDVFHTAHENMLNMGASSNDAIQKSHVEFRMWDGSLDPGVIQRQVMASVAMTDHAEQSVIKNNGSKKPVTARKKRGDHKGDEGRVLAEAGVSEHTPETLMKVNESNARFFDTVFTRQQDRERVLHLFAANKWQS